MQVVQFVNSFYASNTYLLSEVNSNNIWIIDIGDFKKINSQIICNKTIKGVFITHSHFDHIYGINDLIDVFPECVVYTSEKGKEGLFSDKLNYSRYHGNPFLFSGKNVEILHDGDSVSIFENINLEVTATPGHDPGCLSYKVDNYIFTGDSYIPNVKVVTKLRGGNKEEAEKSIVRIKSLFSEDSIICPGHGEMLRGSIDV